MPDLYHHSIKVILAHQSPSGGYLASPTFPDQQFSIPATLHERGPRRAVLPPRT